MTSEIAVSSSDYCNEVYCPQESPALKYMLAWSIAEMEEEREIFGEDLWPYGLEANRHVLETLVQYAHEQGLIKKQFDLESLFVASTLEDFKI